MKPSHHGDFQESRSDTPVLRCRICHHVVPIEKAKTDSDGKAVHEDRYFLQVNQERSTAGNVNGQVKEENGSY